MDIISEVGDKEQKQFKNVFLSIDRQVVSDSYLISNFFGDYLVGVVLDLNLSSQDEALNMDRDNNFNNK